jgi:hypothetical protein
MDILSQYFDTVELTFDEVKLRIKQLYKDREFYGETPQEFLKAVVYETKIRDTIIVMKMEGFTKEDKENFYWDDWKEIKPNVYKWINSRTGNVFIIDGNEEIKLDDHKEKTSGFFEYICKDIEEDYPEIYEDLVTQLGYQNDSVEKDYKRLYNLFTTKYTDIWKEM